MKKTSPIFDPPAPAADVIEETSAFTPFACTSDSSCFAISSFIVPVTGTLPVNSGICAWISGVRSPSFHQTKFLYRTARSWSAAIGVSAKVSAFPSTL